MNREYLNSEITAAIDEVVHSQRDRTVMKLRFVEGYTYERIGEACELSPRYVAKIIRKHERSIFAKIL